MLCENLDSVYMVQVRYNLLYIETSVHSSGTVIFTFIKTTVQGSERYNLLYISTNLYNYQTWYDFTLLNGQAQKYASFDRQGTLNARKQTKQIPYKRTLRPHPFLGNPASKILLYLLSMV